MLRLGRACGASFAGVHASVYILVSDAEGSQYYLFSILLYD